MLRSILLAASRSRFLRRISERSLLGRRLSSRFVAGVTVEQAIAVCRELNRNGLAVTLDYLGESVSKPEEAEKAAQTYHRLLDVIAAEKLNANVSLKLSQMGIEIDPSLAESVLGELVARAARLGNFVRIDMESSTWTEATIAITERLHAAHSGAVGTVLQAYLYRTEKDAERLLGQRIRIRLCKGAYLESAHVAFQRKQEVDKNYVGLMKRLLTSSVCCGIATHDLAIVNATTTFAAKHSIAKDAFEFQMLYGIRRGLQKRLANEGYRVRVYLPFGEAWYPYFVRRLAERPANLLFLLRNALRG